MDTYSCLNDCSRGEEGDFSLGVLFLPFLRLFSQQLQRRASHKVENAGDGVSSSVRKC